jgi:hypothetical protein
VPIDTLAAAAPILKPREVKTVSHIEAVWDARAVLIWSTVMSVVVASVAARFSRPCHGRRDASALGLHGVDNGRMHFADLAAEDHGATALRCACALERAASAITRSPSTISKMASGPKLLPRS